jgi:hypothetical protein
VVAFGHQSRKQLRPVPYLLGQVRPQRQLSIPPLNTGASESMFSSLFPARKHRLRSNCDEPSPGVAVSKREMSQKLSKGSVCFRQWAFEINSPAGPAGRRQTEHLVRSAGAPDPPVDHGRQLVMAVFGFAECALVVTSLGPSSALLCEHHGRVM